MKCEKTKTKTCQVCGKPYQTAAQNAKYCKECNEKLYSSTTQEEKRTRSKKQKNQSIYDAVREAAKHGITYGQYMCGRC